MILSIAQKLSNYLVEPYECYLVFVILDNMRKTGQIIFFQNLVFSTTNYVLKKCSYKFQSTCQQNYWTVIDWSLGFITLDNTRKYGPKFFVIANTAFFRNICIDLLDPKEMFLSLAQKKSKHLADPDKLFLEVCHTR